MTNEEALKVIKENLAVAAHDWDDPTDEYQREQAEAFQKAKEALEKQIPKKPIEITRNAHCTKVIGYGCPTCHKDVVGSGWHCWNCGQKLDWRTSDAEIH